MLVVTGHFIPASKGNILLTQYGQLTDTAILCLPSITEEMNLARAVVAKQAHYFAAQGIATVSSDYAGTGDSEAEFDQVTCDDWLQDIVCAGQWMMAQGVKQIIVWGIRFGSLLALTHQQTLAAQLPIVAQLHWKPVMNGKQFASQFLRIKQASNMMTNSAEKTNWREHILAGNTVEVAGYPLTAKLLESIEALKVTADFQPITPLVWIELAAKSATPAVARYIDNWSSESCQLQCINTPAFWQIPEVFDLPELYPLSLAGLKQLEII
ncbi:hypothetical protein GARC_1586 [Paraglaciecola arctica BSs20135]|uniref:Serine aminopeptidase S33 domain-containing protein n=1 Tax=Paraglaciecola arctica BSs20135 TaxID=493475 RepID=K6YPJ2_9ALTE|nr:hypothetical protein GARC_1586 [Paraglaciecola arctica BSs20135]